MSAPERSTAKAALLTAAEELIATRGLHGPTASEVVRAAGQRNNSAIGYHFGSWDSLVDAVWARHAQPINADRQARLLALRAEGAVDLRSLVAIYVEPIVTEIGRHSPSYWARFNEQWLAGVPSNVFARQNRPVVEHEPDPRDVTALADIFERIAGRLTHLEPDEASRRVSLMARFVITALAAWERDAETGPGQSLGELSVELRSLSLALLQASPTAP